jgi:hypothetical protein
VPFETLMNCLYRYVLNPLLVLDGNLETEEGITEDIRNPEKQKQMQNKGAGGGEENSLIFSHQKMGLTKPD